MNVENIISEISESSTTAILENTLHVASIHDQPVTGVAGGCDLIGARSTRDRGRVGTVATRSTSTTRGAGGASTGVGVRP